MRYTALAMEPSEVSKLMGRWGRKGGNARAEKLTADRRKEIATKASKAAAKARSARAAQKKRTRERT